MRDDIDRVDRGWPRAMVDTLEAIQMALGQPLTLMHRIDTDITRHALGSWRFANTNGHRRRSRAVPHEALFAIRLAGAQVIQVGDRDLREPGITRIAEMLNGAAQQHLGCGSRERVALGQPLVQTVSLGQQGDILGRVLASKAGPADPLARFE